MEFKVSRQVTDEIHTLATSVLFVTEYLFIYDPDSVRSSDYTASTGRMMNCQKLRTAQIIDLNASRLI
jgi:hypothetical protein